MLLAEWVSSMHLARGNEIFLSETTLALMRTGTLEPDWTWTLMFDLMLDRPGPWEAVFERLALAVVNPGVMPHPFYKVALIADGGTLFRGDLFTSTNQYAGGHHIPWLRCYGAARIEFWFQNSDDQDTYWTVQARGHYVPQRRIFQPNLAVSERIS